MNGEKEYTNDIQPICVIIIFSMRRKIYQTKEQKQQMQGLHIQFIPCGPIKVIKYVVMCSGLVRFSDVE